MEISTPPEGSVRSETTRRRRYRERLDQLRSKTTSSEMLNIAARKNPKHNICDQQSLRRLLPSEHSPGSTRETCPAARIPPPPAARAP
eukprot:764328-Hanusia_phi.AAC.1